MITAQIASIPEREEMLEKTIDSITNQVQVVNVMLNNYSRVPPYMDKYKNVNIYELDNQHGDAAKFYPVFKEGFVFTCDDDLIYPSNYIERMVTACFVTRSIVTLHGRKMNKKPVYSSYMDRIVAYHCLETVIGYHPVDIGGTGVMLFNTKFFVPQITKMFPKNMADIHIAKQAFEQKARIVVIPHKLDWLEYQHPDVTIWDKAIYDHQPQTDLYNSF